MEQNEYQTDLIVTFVVGVISFLAVFFLLGSVHKPLILLTTAIQCKVKNESTRIPTKIPNTNENWWLVEKS